MNKELIQENVQKLLREMSIEEKVCQLTCVMPEDMTKPENMGIDNGIGTIPVMGGAPDEIAANIANIQTYVLEHSKHKIPVMFHCEALAGTFVGGATQFPLPISLGASFDPDIVEEMAKINARQMHSLGIRQALSPVLDVARDLRWGRLAETYGGDPVLCGAMGSKYVRGMQENGEANNAATLKHFLGYSATQGGLNMSQTTVSERDLRENFARPFEMAIRDAKVKGIMSSYSEYNGKAVCANEEILTDLLRDDLGFEGVVVSDYSSVERLTNVFAMTDNITEAGEMCLRAGMDMELPNPVGYNKQMVKDFEEGRLDVSYLDRAVERVLTLKYELGLFDNPFPNAEKIAVAFGAMEENERKSYEAAKKVITLVKNDNLLPIVDRSKKIAVIGPMGGTIRAFYGCYTLAAGLEMAMSGQNAMAGVGNSAGNENNMGGNLDLHITDDMLKAIYPKSLSTFEALREKYETIEYVEGCDYIGEKKNNYEQAMKAAKDADIVIMTLGGRNGWGTYSTSGEGIDTSNIGLPGNQEELLKKVYEVNPNIVLVHTDCRPVVGSWIYEKIPAIIEAWLPCTYGGKAIAETICGENNPGGRLQMDIPRSIANGPIGHYFNRGTENVSFKKGAINIQGYINEEMTAQLPFGYGLSYTTFAYSDFSVKMDTNHQVYASVKVTNTGDVVGDEVVQLYGVDKYASIVRPENELIGFKRITLEPGESRVISFEFNIDILAFYDQPRHWVVEKGDFEFYVGKNSQDRIFSDTVTINETYVIDHSRRCMLAKVN